MIRPADPKFGDFQANGALQYAKAHRENPRAAGEKLLAAIKASPDFDESLVETSVAGPGFVNFALTKKFLGGWLAKYSGEKELRAAARAAIPRTLFGRGE